MKYIALAGIFIVILIFGLAAQLFIKAQTGTGLLGNLLPQTDLSELISPMKCSTRSPLPGLDNSFDPNILKLNEYQQKCNSFVTDNLMLFSDMPEDELAAQTMAKAMSQKLSEFARLKLHPLVIVEPITEKGQVNFTEFAAGKYDAALQSYFKTLKNTGITDNVMGTWVPFPEANIPVWNTDNAVANEFPQLINKYLGILKSNFPEAKGSILLDSKTYDASYDPQAQNAWDRVVYKPLTPFIDGIRREYIDSFGLQGFPWLPGSKDSSDPILDPAEYLNADLAISAARTLGVHEIWLNTGTFSSIHTSRTDTRVSMLPQKRSDLLNGVLSQAAKLKQQGFIVNINLFAQDKSGMTEATDWSYWGSGRNDSAEIKIFKEFISQAEKQGIGLTLFDTLPEAESP